MEHTSSRRTGEAWKIKQTGVVVGQDIDLVGVLTDVQGSLD